MKNRKQTAKELSSRGKKSKGSRDNQPKQSRTTSELLKIKRNRLVHQLQDQAYPNALKTCQQITKLQGEERPEFRILMTQAKLLIRLDRYSDCLKALDQLDSIYPGVADEKNMITFLRCYCIHKLGDSKKSYESLKFADNQFICVGHEERVKKLLEAQILYKLEKYPEAKKLYSELLSDSDPNHPEFQDLNQNLKIIEIKLDFIESRAPNEIHSNPVFKDSMEDLKITNEFFDGQLFNRKANNLSKGVKASKKKADQSRNYNRSGSMEKGKDKTAKSDLTEGNDLSAKENNDRRKKASNRWKPKRRKRGSPKRVEKDIRLSEDKKKTIPTSISQKKNTKKKNK
ncbi:hypothetical protein BY996DRAFT_2136407 [Phakopsora pachyrhizi]|uniref:Expressed protein n=1 Tax=Phakopsora pachyrhizi TaxID=170000 RepID=A0AAV0B661_PHAPC|nr:hypothetical protein BY996DRAFT_2136407 [Phakopsora pachyrhizi]CAH7676970.1 expressed protein [Phakopsora pachyrhizi]